MRRWSMSELVTHHDSKYLRVFLIGRLFSIALFVTNVFMNPDGRRTNNYGPQIFRLPDCVFRIPFRLDQHPPTPPASRGDGSSGSAIRACPNRKNLADDGRRAAQRRGAPIEVDAKDPTLERDAEDGRRRFSRDRKASSRRNWTHAETAILDSRHTRRSPAPKPEAMAGNSQGDPCGQVARKGSRILGSSVRRAFGRGRPGSALYEIDATTSRIALVTWLRSPDSIT